jgi:hypothetical protein
MNKTALWIMLWGSLLAGNLYGDRHKLSKDLDDKLGQAGATVDVIVQYQNDPSDADIAKFTGKGAKLKDHLKRFRTASYTVPVAVIDPLSDDPNVIYVSADRQVNAQFDYSEQAINAPYAWQLGLDGTGVGIALVDSGVSKVDDLEQANSHKSRVVYQEIFNGRKETNTVTGRTSRVFLRGTGSLPPGHSTRRHSKASRRTPISSISKCWTRTASRPTVR